MIVSLTRGRATRRWRPLLFSAGVVLAGAVTLPLPAFGAVAAPDIAYTKLTLINGWGSYSPDSATPAVADINGIVQFKGAISTSSSSTNDVAFILPPAFWPSKTVNVPVDMCNSTGGELNIAPTGVTQVISEGANSNATCFTSLDGASFALSPKSFTALKLQPTWTQFGRLFRKAAGRLIGGVVHLEGEIRPTSNKAIAFTLPPALRPSKDVNVLINVCTGSIGRLHITPKGIVSVRSEEGFWAVKCGTSLDGATFALSATSFTPLTLQNGWINAPSGTAKAAVRTVSGVARFRGAIRTSGTNSEPFVLPSGFRPAKDVYVPVDLCNGGNGRLVIQPDGTVEVQAQSSFTDAQCLTSLDGVSFVP
jgi:hypothetical protein